MKKVKAIPPNDMSLNVQFENAFNWLRAMKIVNSSKELANKLGISEATISAYRQYKREVTGNFAYKLETKFLRKHKLTMEDFTMPYLVDQAQKLMPTDTLDILSLLGTKVLWIEGGVQTILEELSELKKQNKQMGELLRKLTKKKV